MKHLSSLLCLCLCMLLLACQSESSDHPQPPHSFVKTYGAYDSLFNYWHTYDRLPDTTHLPLIHTDTALSDSAHTFQLFVRDQPLGLTKQEIVLENPYDKHAYPLSFSVIYQDRLVSLFAPGRFVCYRINDLSRDFALEKQLNTRTFEQHWLLENRLVGLSDGVYWYWDTHAWQTYTGAVVPENRQKLYEDEKYLAYASCKGEFGGMLFFYNKAIRRTHYIEATCARTVWKSKGKYHIHYNLAHGFGNTGLKTVVDPDQLPVVTPEMAMSKYPSPPNADTFIQSQTIFDFWGISFYSGFQFQGRTLYLAHWRQAAFLVTVDPSYHRITVIDPLLNGFILAHEPVTTQYSPSRVLISIDFDGVNNGREMSCLLFNGNTLTKINWNRTPLGPKEFRQYADSSGHIQFP